MSKITETILEKIVRKASKTAFAKYLRSTKREFRAQDDCRCPLACFLREEFGLHGVKVGVHGDITVREVETGIKGWMQEFIERVDDGSKTLRSPRALAILASV